MDWTVYATIELHPNNGPGRVMGFSFDCDALILSWWKEMQQFINILMRIKQLLERHTPDSNLIFFTQQWTYGFPLIYVLVFCLVIPQMLSKVKIFDGIGLHTIP